MTAGYDDPEMKELNDFTGYIQPDRRPGPDPFSLWCPSGYKGDDHERDAAQVELQAITDRRAAQREYERLARLNESRGDRILRYVGGVIGVAVVWGCFLYYGYAFIDATIGYWQHGGGSPPCMIGEEYSYNKYDCE
jgi:hypothetical protein